MAPGNDTTGLRNLGPLTTARLAAVGVRNLAQLRRMGAVAAYVALRRAPGGRRNVTLNALYALAGALQDRDWREVRRMQKLELAIAVEDHERAHPAGPRVAPRDELLALRNIGPAMRRDLRLLGVGSVRQLARCSPERLYRRLEQLTGKRQDPCVLDTFAAAIHQARTGEARPWWEFSRQRKRQAGAREPHHERGDAPPGRGRADASPARQR
jgi:hypothetical protein